MSRPTADLAGTDGAAMTESAAGVPVAVVPPPGRGIARRAVGGVLVPVVTAAIAVTGLRTSAPGGLPALTAVAFGLVLSAAVSAAVLARTLHRTALWPVTLGGLTASAGLTAARIGAQASGAPQHAARDVATLAGPLVIAASFLLFIRVGTGGGYFSTVLPGVLVFGLGVAIMVAPLTATAATSASSAASS